MINALIVGDVWLSPTLISFKEQLSSSLTCVKGDKVYDLFVANLEAPLLSSSKRFNRRAVINTESSLLDYLNIAHKNILILANNHISDFGQTGLIKTIVECKKRGFEILGAGINIEEAKKPVIIEIGNCRIALMAYADVRAHVGAIAATSESAGIAPLDPDLIVASIRKISSQVDFVWLFLHWGNEFVRYPHKEQVLLARLFVEEGVSQIFGHHPHVLQGSERINQSDIFYSLGNFIFPDIPLEDGSILRWSKVSRTSMALRASLINKSWSFEKAFCYLNNLGLPECGKKFENYREFFDKLSNISASEKYKYQYYYYNLLDRLYLFCRRFNDPLKLKKDIVWFFKRLSRR